MLPGVLALAIASTKVCGVPGLPLLLSAHEILNPMRAARLAYTAAFKIYGRETIDGELPLNVKRIDRVWKVQGELAAGDIGGVVYVATSAQDGTVIDICHGK